SLLYDQALKDWGFLARSVAGVDLNLVPRQKSLEAADLEGLLGGTAVEDYDLRLRNFVDRDPGIDGKHLERAGNFLVLHLDRKGDERRIDVRRRRSSHCTGAVDSGGNRSCEPTVSCLKSVRSLIRATCG